MVAAVAAAAATTTTTMTGVLMESQPNKQIVQQSQWQARPRKQIGCVLLFVGGVDEILAKLADVCVSRRLSSDKAEPSAHTHLLFPHGCCCCCCCFCCCRVVIINPSGVRGSVPVVRLNGAWLCKSPRVRSKRRSFGLCGEKDGDMCGVCAEDEGKERRKRTGGLPPDTVIIHRSVDVREREGEREREREGKKKEAILARLLWARLVAATHHQNWPLRPQL